MGTINFYLKAADKKGDCPIILTYQKRGEKFRYYTKLKVIKASWEGQRIKPNYIGFSEVNAILDDIENTLKAIEREAVFNKKEYSIETIKRKFFLQFGGLQNSNDFFNVFDKFLNDIKSTKAIRTVKGFDCLKQKLLKFSDAKKILISFEAIDYNFYEAFVNYMLLDVKNLNNTIGNYVKNLKVFLNYAVDREYTSKNFNLKKFKVFRDEVDSIYLTEKELMTIYRKDNLVKRLLHVKDVFCFACFTGLRFSDIDKLNNTHIKENYLEIKTEKTKDSLKIPLNIYTKQILNKYKGKLVEKPLPTGLTNQKTNEYLKEIGELCKITEVVSFEQFSGSNKVVTTNKKFGLLTTHTARRTFVTLALEKGIRAEVVMSMTGHKNYKTFMKYVKITDKIKEQEMNRVWGKAILKVV